MTASKTGKLRLDTMKKSHFTTVFFAFFIILVVAEVIDIFAPSPYFAKIPNDSEIIPIQSESLACRYPGLKNKYLPETTTSNCWAHMFTFNYQLTQFFALEMKVHRNSTSHSLDEKMQDMKLNVIWLGMDEDESYLDPNINLVAQGDITRPIECREGEKECNSVIVFHATSVTYRNYFFQVHLLDTKNLDWMEGVSFVFFYKNYDYSVYELSFKAFYFFLSVIMLTAYAASVYRAPGTMTYEQKWILTLLGVLTLFNDPFYFFKYTQPNEVNNWWTMVSCATFVFLLALFWIVTFDGLVHDPPFKFSWFYLPKMLFVFISYLVFVISYGIVQTTEGNDLLYDWYSNTQFYTFIRSASIIGSVLYSIWIVVLLVKGLTKLKLMADKQRVIYAFHLCVLINCILSALFAEFRGVTAAFFTDYQFFYTLLNVYVYILAFIYSPIATNPFQFTGLEEIEEDADIDDEMMRATELSTAI